MKKEDYTTLRYEIQACTKLTVGARGLEPQAERSSAPHGCEPCAL